MKRLFLFVLSLLLTCTSTYAETLKAKIIDSGKVVILFPDKTWKYDTTAKINEGNFGIPEKRKFNHPPFSASPGSSFLYDQYDKFTNQTSCHLRIEIKINSLDSSATLRFDPFYFYEGKQIQTPSIVSIGFTSKSKDWEYLNSRNLIFLIDGERLNIGELDHDGSVGDGYVLEFLRKTISIKQFLRIVNAKNVEGQLFATTFKFTEEQLEALRDYASRMK